jgi:phosphatidylinositol alpha-1,6-mannosyltransferase
MLSIESRMLREAVHVRLHEPVRGGVPNRPPAPEPAPASARSALLLSELFPPAVGGSPLLFESIYSRFARTNVVVLADVMPGVPPHVVAGPLAVFRASIATRRWGLLDTRAVFRYLQIAARARHFGSRRDVVVHCARALPEGVAAWISRHLGGPEYVCWSHGEDIGTALRSRQLTWLMSRVYRDAAANVVNSYSTARMLEQLGIARARITVVHPGVDVGRFRPSQGDSAIRERFAPRGETVLLSVGRLQRRKGHDLAIEAVSRLRGHRPLTYLIVGDGQERSRLQALARERGVADRVHFLGEVSEDDLPLYYQACDVFLMPNRVDAGDVEGFGIVFLEAAAAEKPSIGGHSGGVPEAIADGETGLLVSGTDVDELARTIEVLASSPERRRALGRAGRVRVCRDFTWRRAAQLVEHLHQSIANRAPR